ncbi:MULTISPECIES: hypothetical protein [Massilia]|uniref:Uncharacterized protein n=1 Tax=Massilia orientalis TaxID=3050128 RepID=A0ACC7MG86_9BURK|nr:MULTISPECIES: hypothetical protein [Telluria group]MDN4045205.1 hypothetical protein [Massilia sp. YIM B02787]
MSLVRQMYRHAWAVALGRTGVPPLAMAWLVICYLLSCRLAA